MARLALLLWLMGGTALAGVAVMIVLVTPSLQFEEMHYIPIAAICGFIVGVPLAFIAAKAITHGRA